MLSSIVALSPIFASNPGDVRGQAFYASASVRENFIRVCSRLAGKPNFLIGLYVTFNPDLYNPKQLEVERGRVIALARVLPMPAGKSVNDYPSEALKFRRDKLVDPWPIGWPCETVFYSHDAGPYLLDVVYATNPDHKDFTSQLHFGPVDLGGARYARLRDQLMKEVRDVVVRNPSSQLHPF
jgi:hypothetical protein